jgi:hypothetical protein
LLAALQACQEPQNIADLTEISVQRFARGAALSAGGIKSLVLPPSANMVEFANLGRLEEIIS